MIAICLLGIAALAIWVAGAFALGLLIGRAIPPSHSDIHRNDAADSQGSAGSGAAVSLHVAPRNTAKSE